MKKLLVALIRAGPIVWIVALAVAVLGFAGFGSAATFTEKGISPTIEKSATSASEGVVHSQPKHAAQPTLLPLPSGAGFNHLPDLQFGQANLPPPQGVQREASFLCFDSKSASPTSGAVTFAVMNDRIYLPTRIVRNSRVRNVLRC